jgi:putative ABC transport system permease protein
VAAVKRFLLRVYNFFRPERAERELARELTSHLTLLEDEFQRRGMTPEDARLAAMQASGGIERAKDLHRDARSFVWLEDARRDLRYAARTLARTPGFTGLAVLTLALGIGANASIFSIVNAVLVQPLPFPDSDRLVHVLEHIPASTRLDGLPFHSAQVHASDFLEWQRRTETLSDLAAYDRDLAMTITSSFEPVRVVGASVTPSLFPLLGVPPLLGRGFDETDGGRTIVLSYRMWQGVFGADPSILDRTIALDGSDYEIVAVMPREFAFPDPETAFWLPLTVRRTGPGELTQYQFIGRLRNGVGVEAAEAEAEVILKGVRGYIWPDAPLVGQPELDVLPAKEYLVAPVRRSLLVLLAGVGFVLLIACSNIANLLLARHIARQREAAVRVALGAGRARLVRQMLTESALLGLMGCVGGLAIAFGAVELLAALGPADLPRLDEIAIDRTVLGFALGLSVLTGLLVGLLPALRVLRGSPIDAIRAHAGSAASSGTGTRGLLVCTEVAMATMLLIGGGLLIRSFWNLSSVNPGFDSRNLLVFQVALPRPADARATAAAVTDTFRTRLESLPAVRSVAIANQLPLRRRNGTMPRIEGLPVPIDGAVDARTVSRSYVNVMGLRLLEGRGFGDGDGPGQPMVILVNETLARHFGGVSPVGKVLTVAGRPAEIVGVVNDTREAGLDRPPRPQAYIDARQSSLRMMSETNAMAWGFFAVRTVGAPRAIVPDVRRILYQLVPEATLELNVDSMEAIISSSVAQRRFYTVALGIFAALAVILAAIGVYGVMAYVVVQRTQEIGIRMALGATRSAVMALVLRQSMLLAVIGIAVGIVGAVGMTRYLEGMLFGVTPLDPTTFFAVAVMFTVVAALASYVPAHRATRLDPLTALRWE